MIKTFRKRRPTIINYRSFKHFSKEEFRKSLIYNLSNQIYVNNYHEFIDFFYNIVKKLNTPKANSNDSVAKNIKDSAFKDILKYKNHTSILTIQKYSKNKTFHSQEVNNGEVRQN